MSFAKSVAIDTCGKCNYDPCICLKIGMGLSDEERKQRLKDSYKRYYYRNKDKKMDYQREYQRKYKRGELEWQQNQNQVYPANLIKTQQLTLIIVNKV